MAQERMGRRPLAGRFGITGRIAAALGVVAVLVALVAASLLAAPAPVTIEREEAAPGTVSQEAGEAAEKDEGAASQPEAEESGVVVVHVDGAVASPGVYELTEGSRANDAIAAAGGLAPEADTSGLNLAATLADGEKLHVPAQGEEPAPATGAAVGTTAEAQGEGGLVNLNTATVAELDELPGVGESTARAIVEDREKNGPFSTPEDLMRVSGIGEKKFEKLEAMVCV